MNKIKAKKCCPVCGEPWALEGHEAEVHYIAHLVQDHAWLIRHAIAYIKNSDTRLDPAETRNEISRLRSEVRKLNDRINWLKSLEKRSGK